jgi:hypothetical protein
MDYDRRLKGLVSRSVMVGFQHKVQRTNWKRLGLPEKNGTEIMITTRARSRRRICKDLHVEREKRVQIRHELELQPRKLAIQRESAYKERGNDRHDPLSRAGVRGMKGGIVWE